MRKFFLTICLMSIGITLLIADISDAGYLSDLPGNVIFGGRQAVSAQGNNLAFCYTSYQGEHPDDTGMIYYQYSTDGGQTYQRTFVGGGPNIDGNPTLLKDGQEVIITYSAGGYIKRSVSTNGGVSFTDAVPVQGSDRLPITDKYDGEYHSLYNYQDFNTNFGYGENPLSNSYGQFTDYAQSSNGTPMYYWGPDVVYGTVRSNNDIWVKQAGGGVNAGWPTFYGPVVTSGNIQSFSGTPPFESVFRGGYFEGIPNVNYIPLNIFDDILDEAQVVGITDPASEANRITMVTVNGGSYSWRSGLIQVNGFDTYMVYSDYPPGNGAPLFANTIPHVDTLWTEIDSGNTGDNTMFLVNSPLWIKGTFSGTQTWVSPYNIFLMDDISLSGTPLGQSPDGTEPGTTVNQTDKVAIISGKNIYIQYGYKDPGDGLRKKPNCGGDADGIYIYASLYALGESNGGPGQHDGVFTFEYQHPHPSIPAVNISNPDPVLWDNIDLHRRHFPQTSFSGPDRWPANIDYPWYNPLWPEGNPTMERGTIHLYGSVNQRRWGFMHRVVNEVDYPNTGQIWNIDIDFCGGPAGASVADPILGNTFAGVNAPNSTGGGVGYKKDFHFDNRISGETFGFNPWNFGIRMESSNTVGQWQTVASKMNNDNLVTKAYERKYAQSLFSLNDRLFRYQNENLAELSDLINARGKITQLDLLSYQDALIYKHDRNFIFPGPDYSPDSLHVFLLNLNDGTSTPLLDGYVPTEMNDTAVLGNNLKVVAKTNAANEVQLYGINNNNELIPFYSWNPNQAMLSDTGYDFSKARMTIVPSGGDSLYIMLWLPLRYGEPGLYMTETGALFVASGAFSNTVSVDEPEVIPPVKLTLTNYPNPFNPSTTVSFTISKDESVSLKIYNTKGELVKTLAAGYQKAGKHDIVWDGLNEKGKTCTSGVYFSSLTSGKANVQHKMILMK